MEIEKKKKRIFPFIDELVEALSTPEIENLLNKHVQSPLDKRTFLMFIMMYFTVEMKAIDTDTNLSSDDHKEGIKLILTELIKNPEKRKRCIEVFNQKVSTLFLE